ncbi:MAG: hypothetical protein AAF721_10190 [Myxococcota bacterium]
MVHQSFRSAGLALAAGLLPALVAVGCQPKEPTANPAEVAEADPPADEAPADEGDELDEAQDGDAADDPMAVAGPPGSPTEHITFDEDEPNPGPTDMIASQPERPANGSMLTPDVLSGPRR